MMNYKLNPELAKIKGPVMLVIDGNEQIYEDGSALTELTFERNYLVDSISARDNTVVVVLRPNHQMNDIHWVGEEAVSFF